MLHQMMLNADGRRRGSIMGYAASRSSESYSSEQQVVEFRSSPRVSSPKKIVDYKDPETFSRGSPFLVPWSSPRAGNGDHRVQEFSSPRKASPPNYGNNDRRVFQEFSPRKASSQNYGNNDHRAVVQEFSTQKASSPSYGKSSEQRFHGNKQDCYSSNYNGYDDSEYEEDENGDYYDYDDDGLKGKNNRVHVRDDPIMKDNKGKSHYDSSSGRSKHNQGISYNNTHDPPYDNGVKYYKGNEYSSSPRNSNYGAGPFSNKPKKETYYEPSHGGPIGNNNNSGLAPIKTRPNYSNRVTDYPDEAERTKNTNPKAMQVQQPKFNSSRPGSKDQREYQETIDSNEARRRYGRSSPRAGPTVEESYTHAIDSREAARRYNGVFVP